ncbi:hypothetical protein BDQ17DRAFT_1434537 [Cyathus striatus]|nr:hypothetical protein BDQ17DRAFT_1434537 [Cyathus striatus]
MANSSGITGTNQHPEFYIQGGDLHLMVGSPLSSVGIEDPQISLQKPYPMPLWDTVFSEDVWRFWVSLLCSDDTFKVDHIHFRVFSYLFTREPSSIFHELLKPSPSPGVLTPGSSHDTALAIDDVKLEDLEVFLRVVLNCQYTNFDFMTTENWITVLNIAHKWRFDVLKNSAIQELQKIQLDTVLRIALYQKNDVDTQYILPLYVDLYSRNETPTKQKSKLLGHEATFVVFQAKELMLKSPAHTATNGQSPPRSQCKGLTLSLGLPVLLIVVFLWTGYIFDDSIIIP